MTTRVNPNDCTVRRTVKSVGIDFYTDEDVRERSVLEITSSQAFDQTHNPLPGGLYDPRLGASERDPYCITCALPVMHCPGHYGHIELALPCYHPMLFPETVEFLRLKCLHCHKLRGNKRQLKILMAKFHLLYSSQLTKMNEIDEELAVEIKNARNPSQQQQNEAVIGAAMDQLIDKYLPSSTTRSCEAYHKLTSYQRQVRKQLLQELISICKGAKRCAHCAAISPKIRQDSSNKIFRATLSKKSQRLNAAENIKIQSALVEEERSAGGGDDDDDDSMASVADEDEEEEESSSENEEDDDDEQDKPQAQSDHYMVPTEVEAQLRRTFALDTYLCNCILGRPSFDKERYKIAFLRAIPVPPSRFRPAMELNGIAVESGQTQYLSKIIQLNELVRNTLAGDNKSRGYSTWIDLQTTINCFMDSSKDPSATPTNLVTPGIRQILERKEGLFRKNMMGKRVNYACRSVISPDPYVGANEIGLPQHFCNVLTYPTPVTDLNIKEMRQLVERGPHNYPGARWVQMEGRRTELSKMTKQKREAIAAKLLTHLKRGGMPTIVGRQLRDGDYVLMNRQPTLHKPGIMAHRVRVLHNPKQRTIRMHYANCNTYNADFDGDEMNCHFPQSDLARAEAQYIAQTDLQYIVPTDGSPLRGLIQDHVVGGVKLTKKDTFLEKWEYQQLLFAALASLPGIEIVQPEEDIELLPPVLIKPRELWTGKQVLSTVLLHLRKNGGTLLPGLSMERSAKTPESAFGATQEEHRVLIRDGELLRGVLDKSAFGATGFSLVHATFEAYGPERAGLLLNALGRLFTAYIQYYSGHSCRTEDLILTKEADSRRRQLVQRAYNRGSRAAKAWAESEGGRMAIADVESDEPLKPVETAAVSAKIGQLLSGNEGKDNFATLDGFMQSKLNPLASDIVKDSLPDGLAVPFPYNTFSIMTTTGAKGSIVNQSQVTCALGQQALEGRRVPRLSSGRTLPSFAPYDPNPRADGFVMDRFLTGIRPQEYYFHCMAGREGLVDTAVKTSRSGYLQRCLIKHLEELKLGYDHTVRNAEGSVVQFLYGEDGLDPTKASYLDCSTTSFQYMARNFDLIKRQCSALPHSTIEIAAKDASKNKRIKEGTHKFPVVGDHVLARKLRAGTEWKRGALCKGWHKAIVTKVHGKGEAVDLKYLDENVTARKVPVTADLGRSGSATLDAASSTTNLVVPHTADPILSSATNGHRIGCSGACVSEKVASAAASAMNDPLVAMAMSTSKVSSKDLSSLIGAKFSSSLCAPGEAVGSIAAQSIGEPSTQMTLNTFHLAGAGANVTLGIPRLREIIMTASRELKTPTMSVPLHSSVTEKQATRLTRDFSRLTLLELISGHRGVTVSERLEKAGPGEWMRSYYVTIKFQPAERIREAFGLTLHDIAAVVAKNFVPLLSQYMKKEFRRSAVEAEVIGGDSAGFFVDSDDGGRSDTEDGNAAGPTDELNDSDVDDDVDEGDMPTEEDGADAARYRRRATSVSYEDDGAQEDDESDSKGSLQGENGPSQTSTENERDEIPMTSNDKQSPTVNERTNSITLQPLQVDPSAPPLLMVGLVEKAASATLIRAKRKIEQAFVNEEEEGRGRCLQTAGVNFEEIWKLELVDHTRLLSNDIWAIRCAYGVEAARQSIVRQITGVFGAYGIEVDPRHLSLIADYMTFDGGFKAMNRTGMESSVSPFLQMSFERTVHFLKQAALMNESDDLASPSGNLVVGRPVQHGTGSFALLTKSYQ